MKKLSKKASQASNKIDKNTKLLDLLDNPKLVEVLQQHNLPCLFCPFARFEAQDLTLAQICQTYDLDIISLVKDLYAVFNIPQKKLGFKKSTPIKKIKKIKIKKI